MRIRELKIYSENFEDQNIFYREIIGLKLIESSDFQSVFEIGSSNLRIVRNENFSPYHFAINIPCNMEFHALKWLKERVRILTVGNIEIQNFDFWNAKAIYFYDMDQNIIEFIARKNLKNKATDSFNINSLIEISEIGVPVNDIKTVYTDIRKTVELKIFDGGFERCCAIGDERGLFICVNKKVKNWFPTGDQAYSSEFEVKIIENGIYYNLKFKNQKISATSV